MQLRSEILTVLQSLGADELEIASLTSYFADRLAAAEALTAQLQENAKSLETQIAEAQGHADIIRTAIGKFVIAD